MLVPCVPRCIPGESCVGTTALSLEITKTPPERGFRLSGRRDSNSGPLVPQRKPAAATVDNDRLRLPASMLVCGPIGSQDRLACGEAISRRLAQDWPAPTSLGAHADLDA
jgi:hypothetical protein